MSSAGPHDPSLPLAWETIREEDVADCRVFRVRRRFCRHPVRQTTGDFFVVESPDWVNVVALTAENEIVMVNQYRFGSEAVSLEIPGGIIEPGEEPIDAARRELLEETGFGEGEARLLGSIHPNPAIQNNHCHLVFLDGARCIAPHSWDEHEEIQVETIPVDAALARAREGKITHALTLDAFFLFEPEWRRRRGG